MSRGYGHRAWSRIGCWRNWEQHRLFFLLICRPPAEFIQGSRGNIQSSSRDFSFIRGRRNSTGTFIFILFEFSTVTLAVCPNWLLRVFHLLINYSYLSHLLSSHPFPWIFLCAFPNRLDLSHPSRRAVLTPANSATCQLTCRRKHCRHCWRD